MHSAGGLLQGLDNFCHVIHMPSMLFGLPLKTRGLDSQQLIFLGALIFLQVPAQSRAGLSERCRKRCDSHRKHDASYSFNCTEVLADKTTQAECQDDCKYCPLRVCDLAKGPKFRCPPKEYKDPTRTRHIFGISYNKEDALLFIPSAIFVFMLVVIILTAVVGWTYRHFERGIRKCIKSCRDCCDRKQKSKEVVPKVNKKQTEILIVEEEKAATVEGEDQPGFQVEVKVETNHD